jgi:hypothetical protein
MPIGVIGKVLSKFYSLAVFQLLHKSGDIAYNIHSIEPNSKGQKGGDSVCPLLIGSEFVNWFEEYRCLCYGWRVLKIVKNLPGSPLRLDGSEAAVLLQPF